MEFFGIVLTKPYLVASCGIFLIVPIEQYIRGHKWAKICQRGWGNNNLMKKWLFLQDPQSNIFYCTNKIFSCKFIKFL